MIGPEAADMDNEDRARYEWLALRCQAGDPGAFEDLVAVMETTAAVLRNQPDRQQGRWARRAAGCLDQGAAPHWATEGAKRTAGVAVQHHAWSRDRSNPARTHAGKGRGG